MNIAVVDDLASDRRKLVDTLSAYAAKRKLIFNISCFESGEALLASCSETSYDLIFMDIYMGGMSGIETAAKIRETDDDIKIVFLTTSNDCQAEAIHYHAYDYIQKEPQPAAVEVLMDHLIRRSNSFTDRYLSFYYERLNTRIMFAAILSVVADGNNLIITTSDGMEYKPRMTFSSVKAELLTDSRFIEILRGIIVNMNCISDLSGNSCLLSDGRRFPVSLRKNRQILNTWHDFLFEQARKEGRH